MTIDVDWNKIVGGFGTLIAVGVLLWAVMSIKGCIEDENATRRKFDNACFEAGGQPVYFLNQSDRRCVKVIPI